MSARTEAWIGVDAWMKAPLVKVGNLTNPIRWVTAQRRIVVILDQVEALRTTRRAAQGYDLSLNRYKEVVHEAVDHEPPAQILADLKLLEPEIQQGMAELERMLR